MKKLRSNTKLIHGVTKVTSWFTNTTATVLDSTKYTVLVAFDGQRPGVEPSWHNKKSFEV